MTKTTSFFSDQERALLQSMKIPQHIAFIPDGNRRWAREKAFEVASGHREGADVLMDTTKACIEIGVPVVTFYIFSTENWSRSEAEVSAIMWLLKSYLLIKQSEMQAFGIRLQTIGDLSKLSSSVNDVIDATKKATEHCKNIDLVLALNYGGRDEIKRAVQSMLDDYTNKKLKRDDISEASIARYLDTKQWKDPDLLIRTSGEVRLSNFLLWQTSYTEVFVADVLWPDFSAKHLLKAIAGFQKRKRRWGGE